MNVILPRALLEKPGKEKYAPKATFMVSITKISTGIERDGHQIKDLIRSK